MKKGRVLTGILSVLIICSIGMTFRLWFAEKLWPEGYNFFSVWNSFPLFQKEEFSAPRHEELFMPDRIVVNCVGSRRSIYTESNQEFAEIYEIAKQCLTKWLQGEYKEINQIEEKEYYDTLKTRSLLLQYPVEMPVRVLGQLVEIGESSLFGSVSSVTELVLVPGEEQVEVLLQDQADGAVYRFLAGDDGGNLRRTINQYATGNANRTLSAYELGFYRQPEGVDLVPKLILNPFVMLDTSNESQKSEVLEAEIPFGDLDDLEQVEELLRLFGYNPNTIRRYTELSDARVFVSDRSTLRLYPDGLLEYNATESRYGIALEGPDGEGGDAKSFLDSVDRTADWITRLWKTAGLEDMPKMRVTSDISEQHYESFSFSIDYQVNGRPVAVNYEGSELVDPLNHAAELEIQNNRIISMRILLRNYRDTGERVTNMPLVAALDAFSAGTDESYEADDVSLYFIDNGTDPYIRACWSVVLSDGAAVAISED